MWILAFNRLGIDFLTPGNHDFDLGLAWQERLQAASTFPWLCANLLRKGETNSITGRAFTVVEADGARVAFFGLSPGRGEKWSVQTAVKDLETLDELVTATNLVPRLRAQADVVVGVTHIGLRQDRQVARETDAKRK